jgi:multidrug efflux pump subunit AcrB
MTPDRPRLITRPALAAASKPRVTVLLWLILLATGVYAYTGALDREGFPPVNVPIALAEVTWFVDDETEVDAKVAVPVFEAYRDVDGVDSIQTFSRPDGFVAVFEFEPSFSSTDGLASLEAAPLPDLPPEVTLEFSPIDATKFLDTYDMVVTIVGPPDADPAVLEEQAHIAAAALEPLSSVESTEALSLLTESIDPSSGASVIRRTDYTRYAEQGDTSATEAIGVGLTRDEASGLDVLEFSDQIQATIDRGLGLDSAYRAVIGADFASDVRAQLSTLTSNLMFGLIAVAIVSYLLIGWRTAVITAVFMATVMLVTMIGLWAIGYSLNTITFFALVLTLGLLVDDAIVISESIDANRAEAARSGPLGVVRRAVDRVGAASLAGTLSTLTVFAPMAFITGILGGFIRPIPITVIVTLAISFLLSITVIPALGRVFILGGDSHGPLVGVERRISRGLGSLARYPAGHGAKGWATGIGLIAMALLLIFMGMGAAGRIGFNIFPPTKDSNALQVSVDYDASVTIEDARSLQAEIDERVIEVLGEDLDRYQVIVGTSRGSYTFVELTPFDNRSTTSPTYADRIEDATDDLAGVRVASAPVSNGPPTADFPFQVQIVFDTGEEAAAYALAQEIASTLPGQMVNKASGDETEINAAFVSSDGQFWRYDGRSLVEVRAGFDTDDTTGNLTAAEDLVGELWPTESLAARGLSADALEFDFGLESDNQDDFAALGVALVIAIILTVAFLALQFRSLIQPLLVFLAVPFSFFGVFTLLELTDNQLSFFVMVGFIALIGVAVNNTILLVDAANQERRAGASPADAIGTAIEQRFRPLVVTTATTVAGLLPLALSDPFWESLCFVLIGGLVSSTFLVLTTFPAMYLAEEKARSLVKALFRRARPRVS